MIDAWINFDIWDRSFPNVGMAVEWRDTGGRAHVRGRRLMKGCGVSKEYGLDVHVERE